MSNLLNKQPFFQALVRALTAAFTRLDDVSTTYHIHESGDDLEVSAAGSTYEGIKVDEVNRDKFLAWGHDPAGYVDTYGQKMFTKYLQSKQPEIYLPSSGFMVKASELNQEMQNLCEAAGVTEVELLDQVDELNPDVAGCHTEGSLFIFPSGQLVMSHDSGASLIEDECEAMDYGFTI